MLNYLVLGHKGHGKDEACKIMREIYKIEYASSSWLALDLFLYEKLKDKYGYTSKEECYNDRDNHRIEWRDEIRAFNVPKDRLTKLVLEKYNAYCGMRCNLEFSESKGHFDRVLWIDAMERLPFPDESLDIQFDPTCMTRIDNNGPKVLLPEYVKLAISGRVRWSR